eukprot:TRINITY_DN23791_c0_g1_i1.p1 TRINITY_DN23791_c0_g1~~TRINITY_DN23791_c0_g1_i1.p1  ORF type:complete len:444 (+),score=206.71 TRINITY_DN23791_c0_g1_i1:116-1447(+)
MKMLLAVAGLVASAAAAGEWCVAAPVGRVTEWPRLSGTDGKQFRGGFRDLSLYIHSKHNKVAACSNFLQHTAGNDGLWVLEFDIMSDMKASMAKAEKAGLEVLATRNQTYLLSGAERVPEAMGLDACGSEINMRIMSVPEANVRAPQPFTAERRAAYKKYTDTPKASIVSAIKRITKDELSADISVLSAFNSRNSNEGSELDQAITFLSDRFDTAGAAVESHFVRKGYYNQVFATFKGVGKDAKNVVIGAHADSRSTMSNSPTQRAPGADDNGSGTAALLAIARGLNSSGIKFYHNIILMSFTGEEQGLVGSRKIAAEYAANGVEVVGMVNGDMLGYREPGKPITLAFMDKYASEDLTQQAKEVVQTYLPNLAVGDTSGCCSDQQSFHEQGFHSVGLFEHPGSSVQYPHYHKSDDELQYLDLDELEQEAQAVFAIALVMAEAE